MSSSDDFSKIPRLPGDGAQDDSSSKFVESSNAYPITDPENIILHNNITVSEQSANKG